jgi:hypothetical protein
MYRYVVLLHVAGAFALVLGHGASAMVAFKLRTERERDRVHALLDLSGQAMGVFYIGLGVLLIAGVVAGFMGRWWGRGWIWTSLALLILIMVGMYVRGHDFYHRVRKAMGLPHMEKWYKNTPMPAQAPSSPEEIDELLRSSRPFELLVMGGGGIFIILYLMLLKPF